MSDFKIKERYSIQDLLDIMKLLRSEDGCPWDKVQTHETIRMNFIEEVYEAVEAIDTKNGTLLREELGDVLLQVVFHAQMEEEQKNFTFGDVVDEVCQKLVVRHPHIFADVIADTAKQVLTNWESIKKSQKGHVLYAQTIKAVPITLPALMKAEKIVGRAAKCGFEYTSVDHALECVDCEYQELKEAIFSGDTENIEDELGDVLFNIVNLARKLKLSPERALEKACKKFAIRFEVVEQLVLQDGKTMEGEELESLYEYWGKAKKVIQKNNS